MKRLCALLLLCATMARAQDSVASDGPVSDAAFYRAVACAAPPGQDCTVPLVRWRNPGDLTVSLYQIDPDFPPDRRIALEKALSAAIAQLNASGSALRLRFAPPGVRADVTVHLLDMPMGGRIHGTGLAPLDGALIEAALVQLWWNGSLELTRAAIVFPGGIDRAGLQSIALEELTQAMGLRTDIDNRWYERRSVFSQTSNAVVRLGDQDIMALQGHYPPTK